MNNVARIKLGLFASALFLVNFLSAYSSGAKASVESSETILLSMDSLALARANFQKGDVQTVAAVDSIAGEAEKLLDVTPYTIVHKTMLPPSGDKHDYFSFSPYWWPDPKNPKGKWIRKDGMVNPASREETSDKVALNRFIDAVHVLSVSYCLTDNERYAKKAADLIRTWFLNPETRMNPNLNYAQGIPGTVSGRGIGIIDTRRMYLVLDGIRLISHANQLTAQEQEGLKQWYAEFLDWLITSRLGKDERNTKNNHATFYDFQVSSIAYFVGDEKQVRKALQRAKKRLKHQIDDEGRQKLELARTRPFHYSVFNAHAYTGLARIGEKFGENLWLYPSADDARLKKAIELLIAIAMKKDTLGGSAEETIDKHDLIPFMPAYANAYNVSLNSIRDVIEPNHSGWLHCGVLLAPELVAQLNPIAPVRYSKCGY